MSCKAIVMGATGLVGNALVEKLLDDARFSQVITLSRSRLSLSHEKLVQHQIDFESLDEHAELFAADIMFSCLGTTKKQAGSIAAQRRVDLDYQLQAATLAKKMGVTHCLLVSSSGANASSQNEYLKMKGELEVELESLNFAQLTIVQPSLLLGKRSEFRLGEFIGAYLLPVLCMLPFLRAYRPIRGEQVAQRLVQLAMLASSGVCRYQLQAVFPTTHENE